MEVMVVSAILGGLAYFGMQLIDETRRSQRNMDHRFTALSTTQEIYALLSQAQNCTETFRGISIKDYLVEASPIPIDSFKKMRNLPNDQITILETNQITKAPFPKKKMHMRAPFLKLRNYEKQSALNEQQAVDVYLYIPFHWDSQSSVKKIPLSFNFNEQGDLLSCSTMAGQSQQTLQILDPTDDPQLENISGAQACKDKGMSCLRVLSKSYAARVYGQLGLDNLCQTNYNQNLEAIKQGVQLSPWHSCEAKLGIFDTYKLDSKGLQLTCESIFMAICQ